MIYIKIDKRYEEGLDAIRKRVTRSKTMTNGEKNAILNHCNKLGKWAKKANAQLQRGQYLTAAYDARTNDDIAAQMRAKKAVFAALLAGRRIDLTHAAEFHVSQMHTCIAQIRRDIRQRYPSLRLCDEWVRPEGTRPYKQYWIIQKTEQ